MHESTPLSHYVFTQVYKPSPMSYTAPDLNHDSSTHALSAASKKRDEPLTCLGASRASNRTTIKIDIGCATCENIFSDAACSTKVCHMNPNRLELKNYSLFPSAVKNIWSVFSYHKPRVSIAWASVSYVYREILEKLR